MLGCLRSKEDNRRIFPRVPVRQAATLVSGDKVLPCEIRDFCQAGLYVVIAEGVLPQDEAALEPGEFIEVLIPVEDGDAKRELAVSGKVVRTLANGAGIYVEAMPESVFQALDSISLAQAGLTVAEAGSDLGSDQKQTLRQECTSRFSAFLDTVLQEFFPEATSKLLDAGYEVTFLEQSRYVFGAREVEKRRGQIQDAFFAAIRSELQLEQQAAPEAANRMAGELSLVDEHEFDDWLHISSVSNHLETDHLDQLLDIEKRFGLLVGQPIDRMNNPFGPPAICRALQRAVLVLDFTNAMRSVLYRTWGEVLSRHLGEFYQQLRGGLSPVQLPQVQKRIIHRGSTPPIATTGVATQSASTPVGDAAKLSEVAESLSKLYRQMQSSIPSAPEAVEFNLDKVLANVGQTGKRRGSGAFGTRSGFATPTAGAAPRRHYAFGSSSRSLMRLSTNLRKVAQETWKQQVSGDAPVPAESGHQPSVSVEDLLAVIDSLPLETLSDSDTGSSLMREISERLAMTGAGNRRIAPAYRQSIDAAAGLFSAARTRYMPASELETLLKRLERPLLKLALKDGSFLDVPDHPARSVINLLDQFAIAADDQGRFMDSKLQRFLSLLVDRIVEEGGEDVAVYEAALERLEKVLPHLQQMRMKRVYSQQEACEARERIRQAREQVNQVFEERLAGKDVPTILLQLIESGWRQYLVLLLMRLGTDSPEWKRALTILDQLHANLITGGSLWPGYAEEVKTLLDEVNHLLDSIKTDSTQLRTLMDDLESALKPGEERDAHLRNTVTFPARAAPQPSSGLEDGLLKQLGIGDWWSFQVEGQWLPMQLIWTNQPPTRCAFANRAASNRLDLDLPELARHVAAGLIKPDLEYELPLLERSEYAVFDESYRRLIHHAHHDPVTALLNRGGFTQKLQRLASPSRLDQVHTVLLLEFDQVRAVYTSCGSGAGDTLLRDLAAEIQTRLRPGDVLAAFTGEAFALLLPECDIEEGKRFADDLLRHLRDYRFRHGQETYSIGASIGVAEYRPALNGPDVALQHAEAACAAAKAKGRNQLKVYLTTDAQLQSEESLLVWAGRIDRILERDGLYLRCQQVLPIGTDPSMLPYYEILLGIRGEAGEDVKPMLFIPAVERWNRSHEIDLWVMARAFDWIRGNRARFDQTGGFSINLSALSLGNSEVIGFLQEELARGELPTDRISFEITETAAIGSYAGAQEFIRQIRRYGCKFVLDDFGSGFASYSHLKNLHLDALKIDGSFVKEIGHSLADLAMVKSMNDIGHSLGLKTVAEFVETPLILDRLREIGVDYAQGYTIHKPTPLAELERV